MKYLRYQGHLYRRAEQYDDIGFTESGRWGNAGSGFLFTTGERILLLERSGDVEEPYTWGLPGGAIPQTRGGQFLDAEKSARNEAMEEIGIVPPYRVVDKYVYSEPGFQYTTFVALVDEEFKPRRLNWENDDFAWVGEDELDQYDLHFGAVAVLSNLRVFR